jgi:ubiquinone/menaquinone biosynthesis C-methylase UbiE
MVESKLENVDCPVCGPSKTTIWLNDHKITRYVRCTQCGTVFSSPRLTQNARHARTDAAWSYSPELLSFEAHRRSALKKEAEFIQGHIQAGKLLDVGCSSGDFFDFFPESQWEKYGVELSSSAAAYAASVHSARVVAGTLQSANWTAEYFDLVSMIDMFYYVDDPKSELIEAWRILKPTGLLAIEITGQAYMFFRSRGVIAFLMEGQWCRLRSDSHLFWFNPTGLHDLLKIVGFSPIAWSVVPGPTRVNRFSNFISSTYFRVYSILAGQSMKMLNWAPKYICLAQRG